MGTTPVRRDAATEEAARTLTIFLFIDLFLLKEWLR